MSDTDIIILIIIIPSLYSAYLGYEIHRLGTDFRAHRIFHEIKMSKLGNKIDDLEEELKKWRN